MVAGRAYRAPAATSIMWLIRGNGSKGDSVKLEKLIDY